MTASLRPPGPLTAYLPAATPERLAECLVAFANSDGGTVIVGLDERGKMLQRVYAEELEGALKAAERLCRPPVVTGWEQLEGPEGATTARSAARKSASWRPPNRQAISRPSTWQGPCAPTSTTR
jgi:hypothetical protein